MDINAHFVRKIIATAHHSPDGGTHWIELEIVERSRDYSKESSSKIVLFTEGENDRQLVDLYTAAINGVTAQFEPSPTEAEAA